MPSTTTLKKWFGKVFETAVARCPARVCYAPGMAAKRGIAIVGPGNLGCALASALRRARFPIRAIVARAPGKSFEKARTLAGQLKTKATIAPDTSNSEVVWFCVPDSEIARASRSFGGSGSWKGRVVLHSSGALTSDELKELRQKGAVVASAHPLMTFVGRGRPELSGVPFALEGDAAAVQAARTIVKALGGRAYVIRKLDKAAYHAWGTFASPLLTALLATTEEVARLAGVSAKEARRRMAPILSQTLANYVNFGAARGFSGPIIRGDVETVKRHLGVLRATPAARKVYVALGRSALEYLPAKNRRALRRLFRE